METFGERLARLRKAKEASRQQLADAVGVTRSAIALVENGQSKGMEADNLLKAAQFLGVDPEELQFGEPERGPKSVAQSRVRYRSNAREVPIIGFAIANPEDDGFFDDMGFPPGTGEGYVTWPTKDPNAYALRVRGDSMSPRIRPGEIVVVEPSQPVMPGEDVLVKTRAGRKMIKRLLYQRGADVTLGSINGQYRETTISLEEIEAIQHIGGIVPRGATTEGTR